MWVEIWKRRLWRGAPLSIRAPSGSVEGCSFTGDLERRVFILLGDLEEGLLYRGLRETDKRRLWMGVFFSFYGGSERRTCRGLIFGD